MNFKLIVVTLALNIIAVQSSLICLFIQRYDCFVLNQNSSEEDYQSRDHETLWRFSVYGSLNWRNICVLFTQNIPMQLQLSKKLNLYMEQLELTLWYVGGKPFFYVK